MMPVPCRRCQCHGGGATALPQAGTGNFNVSEGSPPAPDIVLRNPGRVRGKSGNSVGVAALRNPRLPGQITGRSRDPARCESLSPWPAGAGAPGPGPPELGVTSCDDQVRCRVSNDSESYVNKY